MATHLRPGDSAPAFSAATADGTVSSISDFKGKRNLVLFFYVMDNTPGCTREARAFRDAISAFDERNTAVVGVSTNSVESHERFAANNELPFPLLSDSDGRIAEAYGVLRDNGMSAERTTFLIDKKGFIRHVWSGVSITGHAAEILAMIEELGL